MVLGSQHGVRQGASAEGGVEHVGEGAGCCVAQGDGASGEAGRQRRRGGEPCSACAPRYGRARARGPDACACAVRRCARVRRRARPGNGVTWLGPEAGRRGERRAARRAARSRDARAGRACVGRACARRERGGRGSEAKQEGGWRGLSGAQE
ncbi:hypothetical protein PAHAL_6G158000 [Panicum hallii]|uniref:Uncharacterized protein n=1 Tax=Panicum hallii TaxID=206008 RepID=A0A2T8IGK5_9POAL|nr:hypothetical protein PAHAL_6G158000 [Panicum hallii]